MAESQKFHRHYNHALGKEYHTAREYVSDMKKMGMEPYNPSGVKHQLKGDKAYKPSEWAKKMTKIGCDQVARDGRTSGAFNAEMAKHLKTEVPERIARERTGGSYTE